MLPMSSTMTTDAKTYSIHLLVFVPRYYFSSVSFPWTNAHSCLLLFISETFSIFLYYCLANLHFIFSLLIANFVVYCWFSNASQSSSFLQYYMPSLFLMLTSFINHHCLILPLGFLGTKNPVSSILFPQTPAIAAVIPSRVPF